MSTDRSADYLMTTPNYYTFAVFVRDSRGVTFQRWTPAVKLTWMQMQEKLMSFPLSNPVMTYYWNGSRWLNYRPGNTISGQLSAISDQLSANSDQRAELVGALERHNPLPPGRYWQDIFEKQGLDWTAWVQPKIADGSVVIEKVERFTIDPLHDGSWLPAPLQPDNFAAIAPRVWVLFHVTRPVEWPAVKLGFPTIADDAVKTSADTATNPPGPSPGKEIADALLDNVVKPALYLGGAYLALKLLLNLRR